jgi:hypothetical protein
VCFAVSKLFIYKIALVVFIKNGVKNVSWIIFNLFFPDLMMSKLNGRQTNSDDILQNSSKTLLRHHNILHESDWLQNGTYTPFKKEKIDGLRAAMDYCNSPYKGQTSKEGNTINVPRGCTICCKYL